MCPADQGPLHCVDSPSLLCRLGGEPSGSFPLFLALTLRPSPPMSVVQLLSPPPEVSEGCASPHRRMLAPACRCHLPPFVPLARACSCVVCRTRWRYGRSWTACSTPFRSSSCVKVRASAACRRSACSARTPNCVYALLARWRFEQSPHTEVTNPSAAHPLPVFAQATRQRTSSECATQQQPCRWRQCKPRSSGGWRQTGSASKQRRRSRGVRRQGQRSVETRRSCGASRSKSCSGRRTRQHAKRSSRGRARLSKRCVHH